MLKKKMNGLSTLLVCILMVMLFGTMMCVGIGLDVIGISTAMAMDTTGHAAGGAVDQSAIQQVHAPLKLGDEGEDVRKMKMRLYELGYFETEAFTEIYDEETAERIALFQLVNELKATGIADAETLALLFSDQAQEIVISEHQEQTYILNTNTKKFHNPNCASVGQMKEKNKKEFTGTRDQAINNGYIPCKNCKP